VLKNKTSGLSLLSESWNQRTSSAAGILQKQRAGRLIVVGPGRAEARAHRIGVRSPMPCT